MARFTTAEGVEFRAIRAACYDGLSSERLFACVNSRLRSMIGLDAYCSNQIDPETFLLTRAVAEGWPYEAKRLLIERVFLQSRVADPSRLFGSGRRSLDVEDWLSDLDAPLDDPYFQYHLLPFGYRHETILLCSFKGRPQALMTLTRKESSGRFEERHMALLNALAPHIAAGLARADVRETLDSPAGSDVGVIVLDESGKVEIANAVADEWLAQDTRKHWPLALPLLVSLASRAVDGSEPPFAGAAVETTHPRTGALYRLHWERQTDASERPRTLILMEPLRPAESPAALERMGLTPRESKVALALLRGLSVSEIAAELNRSPHTVTQHMKSIFDKLGVSSRHELAARLMSKNPSPSHSRLP